MADWILSSFFVRQLADVGFFKNTYTNDIKIYIFNIS